MKRKCLCAALAVSCAINVSFAQVRLQGKVVDESNEPIPGANIRVSESLNGTTTDASGKFELNLPDGRHRIRVTLAMSKACIKRITRKKMSLLS